MNSDRNITVKLFVSCQNKYHWFLNSVIQYCILAYKFAVLLKEMILVSIVLNVRNVIR